MPSHPKILIFDSGAGGLSIAKEIQAQIPHAHLVYAADNEKFPYGLMSSAELLERVIQVMSELLVRFTPDIAVIACNTASTIALDQLRANFSVPFVGVVPAIKPAAMHSSTSVIGLLATPATIERDYTDNLVNNFAQHCNVIRIGSTKLVELAEQEIMGNRISHEELEQELGKLKEAADGQDMDTVVLACTHFPLLKARFNQLNGWKNVQWIDSGEAVARRVHHLLCSAEPTTSPPSTSSPSTSPAFKPAVEVYLTRSAPQRQASYLTYLLGK